MTNRCAVVGLGFVVLVLGCGSSANAPADAAGLDRTRAITTLSASDRAAFCNELAAIEGGYTKQKTITCDGDTATISFTIGANQAECETRFMAQLPPSCASVTVGDLEGCVTAIYSSTSCSLTAILEAPACNTWVACLSAG